MNYEMINPKIKIGLKEYEMQAGTIASTSLGYEDHGIFTFWLHLDSGRPRT